MARYGGKTNHPINKISLSTFFVVWQYITGQKKFN